MVAFFKNGKPSLLGITHRERSRDARGTDLTDHLAHRTAAQWANEFVLAGYRGDGPSPDLGPGVVEQTTARYINAFERLTCRTFVPGEYPVEPRLLAALHTVGVL